MAVTYKKLFHMLIDREMSIAELQKQAGYSANMGLDEENYGISSAFSDFTGTVQEKTAFLPDYAFSNSDSAAGTTVSGLLGSAIVAGAATLICFAGKFFRKKKTS